MATRRIATLRIHVERAMERIKNFQITHFFPGSLCHFAEAIIFACAFLLCLHLLMRLRVDSFVLELAVDINL